MTNTSATEKLAAHAIRTLPDSISARKELLAAARMALPKNSQIRQQAALLIRQLEAHEAAQQEFIFTNGGAK